MTQAQFDDHKERNPHLTFTEVGKAITFMEMTHREADSDFMAIEKTHYLKSNGKRCYTEKNLKKVTVPRYMVTMPKNYTYYWIIRSQYIQEVLLQNGITPLGEKQKIKWC